MSDQDVRNALPDLLTIIEAGRVEALQADFRLIRSELLAAGRDGWRGPEDVAIELTLLDALPPEITDGCPDVAGVVEAFVTHRLRREMVKAIHDLAAEIRGEQRDPKANCRHSQNIENPHVFPSAPVGGNGSGSRRRHSFSPGVRA